MVSLVLGTVHFLRGGGAGEIGGAVTKKKKDLKGRGIPKKTEGIGIVSSTILRLLAFQKAGRKNRPPKLPPCVSVFSKPLELKFQIKTSISPIVSLPELPLLALDQLSANSQEEL